MNTFNLPWVYLKATNIGVSTLQWATAVFSELDRKHNLIMVYSTIKF